MKEYHKIISTITSRGIVIILSIEKVLLSQCFIANRVKYACIISNIHLITNKYILSVLKYISKSVKNTL